MDPPLTLGLTPEPQELEAVQHAEHPQAIDEVHLLLFMIRSNGQFIPNIAAATANLRDLTKDNAVFQWTDAHEAEVSTPKEHQKLPFLFNVPVHCTILPEQLQEAQSKNQHFERLRHFVALGQVPKTTPPQKAFTRSSLSFQ